MHEIIDKKFYLGPKFGTLINKKWITISELLHVFTAAEGTGGIKVARGNSASATTRTCIRRPISAEKPRGFHGGTDGSLPRG
jgi:hypothetical protein